MKTANILKADLLDIIFENRNKDYGAYTLRKYYHERLFKALGITFLLISILSVFGLLQKADFVLKIPEIITSPGFVPPTSRKENVTPPVIKKPMHPFFKKSQQSLLFISNIKLVDSTEESTKLAKDLDSVVISNISNNVPGDHKQLLNVAIGRDAMKGNNNGPVMSAEKEKPLATAEFMPSYPGGTDELIKFLQNNLQNPTELEADQAVSVKIKFIVGYDGILKGFETVEDGGEVFNNEVIRVLKKMPAWIPGRSEGENVSVYYTIPVKFVVQE
jgi:protein TonB